MKVMIDSELGNSIRSDEMGNVTIGKNLEVGGTAKLNGGLKAIHSIDYSGVHIEIYFEKQNTDFENCFSFIGCVEGTQLTIGSYQIENGNVSHLSFLSIDPDGFQEYIDNTYHEIAKVGITQ